MKEKRFTLTSDYIELIKLLKLLNLAESGAHAKFMVDEGEVKLNKETEFRKRAKIRGGDIVECNNVKILVEPCAKM
jgi:ribosome-associated protein